MLASRWLGPLPLPVSQTRVAGIQGRATVRRFIASRKLDIGLSFVAFVWAISPTIFKFALAEAEPMTFVVLRFLLLSAVSIVVLVFYARRHRDIRLFRVRRADVPMLIVSGLSGYGIYQLFYIEGLFRTTAFASTLFATTTPLWSAVMLAAFRIERIRLWQWIGIVVSLCGIIWFLTARPPISEAPLDHALTPASILVGNILLCLGAALFAVYGIVNKRLAKRYSPPELMCYTLLIGTIALLPFGVTSLASQNWSLVTWRLWVILPYSVLFPIYITYSIWNWAIGKRGVGYVTLYFYAVPVLGGIVAFFALGEQLSGWQIVASLVVLGGMLLARWAISHGDARQRKFSERHSTMPDTVNAQGAARDAAD
jgi:drug/metabolite transporter (DMT)-like permease